MHFFKINYWLIFILAISLECVLFVGCSSTTQHSETTKTSSPSPAQPPVTATTPPLVSRFSQGTMDSAYASTAAGTKSVAPIIIGATLPSNSATNTLQTHGQIALSGGVEMYKNSQYTQAISKLQQAVDLSNGDNSTQISAYKYMSFSLCVTGKRTLCLQTFDKLLRLEPSFSLSPAEAGHPIWGAVFRQAKAAAIK
jgi:hypothetical protein